MCAVEKKTPRDDIAGCWARGFTHCAGYGVVTRGQLVKLENQYVPFSVDAIPEELKGQIHFVVILGSGHVSDTRLPVTSQIGCSSLYRLVEGIRIGRELPKTQLVISGGLGYDPIPNADIVADVAFALGRTPES